MTVDWERTSINLPIDVSDMVPKTIRCMFTFFIFSFFFFFFYLVYYYCWSCINFINADTGFDGEEGKYRIEFERSSSVRENYRIDCRTTRCIASNNLLSKISIHLGVWTNFVFSICLLLICLFRMIWFATTRLSLWMASLESSYSSLYQVKNESNFVFFYYL